MSKVSPERVVPAMGLRAVIVGAGWAGEGYTHALRSAGVDVVALCGRTAGPAYAMGRKLGGVDVRLDWRSAIEDLRPDVVVAATPAGPHRDIVAFAAGLGCDLVCEKPLGRTAGEALAMLEMVEKAGVKHAYGATSRYSPALIQARGLLDAGLIGDATADGVLVGPQPRAGRWHVDECAAPFPGPGAVRERRSSTVGDRVRRTGHRQSSGRATGPRFS